MILLAWDEQKKVFPMPSYIPTSLEFDYKTLPFQERKRIRDREVAAQRRLIKRELEETGQTLSREEINARANNRADESLKNNSIITIPLKNYRSKQNLLQTSLSLKHTSYKARAQLNRLIVVLPT